MKLAPFTFDRDREALRFLAPIAVLTIYGLVWRLYLPDLFESGPRGVISVADPQAYSTLIAGRESFARMTVAGTVVLVITLAIAAVAYSLALIVGRRRRGDLTFIAAITVAVAVALLLIPTLDSGRLIGRDSLYHLLDWRVFHETVGRIGNNGTAPERDQMSPGLVLLRTAVALSNVSAIVAGLIVVMATCRIGSDFVPLPRPAEAGDDQALRDARKAAAESEAPKLARALADFRALLLLGSGLLLAGMLAAKAWREWPLAFCNRYTATAPIVCDNAALNAFQQKVAGSVVFDASAFVLILAAIFVPKAAALRNRAVDLAVAAGNAYGTAEATNWQTARGLVWNWRTYTERAVAVLAPLLGTGLFAVAERLMQPAMQLFAGS